MGIVGLHETGALVPRKEENVGIGGPRAVSVTAKHCTALKVLLWYVYIWPL